MVKIIVDDNRLYMLQGKTRYQLESATIYKKPSGYEIIAFILEGTTKRRKTIKQKTLDKIPNAIFCPPKTIDKNTIGSYALGDNEPTATPKWYINYYVNKGDQHKTI